MVMLVPHSQEEATSKQAEQAKGENNREKE